MSEKKVDEDWKRRAREEKQKLAGEEPKRERELVEPSLSLIVSSFVAQALIALGQIQSPVDGGRRLDLEAAKFSIDLLQVLEDKTKGNLTKEEQEMLQGALYDLRMQYVQVSGRVNPVA